MTAPPLCVETDLDLDQIARNDLLWRNPPHVHAILRWTPSDPWAVELDLAGGPTWVIGWELLDGFVDESGDCHGDGAVRIGRTAPRAAVIRLASSTGSATFRVDPLDLAAFVLAVRPRQQAAVRPWIPATAHDLLDAIQIAHEETR